MSGEAARAMGRSGGRGRVKARAVWDAALLWGLVAGLLVFLVYPIGLTVSGAFQGEAGKGPTLRHVWMVFEDPTTLGSIVNSLRVAVATTVLTVVIALPLAVISVRYRFPGKGVFGALVLVPLILPPFVGAIGVKMMVGTSGALNTLLGTEWDILGAGRFWGVVVVQGFSLYPIVFLNTSAALANLDPALEEAAVNLGSGFWGRLRRVTLPLILPGVFAGCTIVFIWSFTELGTPLMFDYTRVAPVQVYQGLKEVENSPAPYALTVVMLVIAVGVYVVGKRVFGSRSYAMYSKASRASGEKVLRGWGAAGAVAAFSVVTVVALMPHAGVVLASFASPGQWYKSVVPGSWTVGHYEKALTHPEAFSSIVNSLKLASLAVVVDVGIGVMAGYLIARTRVRGRGLLDALCMLPLAVPGLVMAFGYVALSLRWPLGKEGPLSWAASVVGTNPNPMVLLVAAYAVRRLPYVVRSTVAGLQQTSGELEEAAVNLGASRWTAVRRVILPLISANLIAGALLAFSFSMLEVSDSLILAQQQSAFPVTKAIFMFTGRLGDGVYIAAAMGVWGMALLTVTLAGASVLMGKRLGSIFRA